MVRESTYKEATTNRMLQIAGLSNKRATNYWALLKKMTCKLKASFGSSPPCSAYLFSTYIDIDIHLCIYMYIYIYIYTCIFMFICVQTNLSLSLCLFALSSFQLFLSSSYLYSYTHIFSIFFDCIFRRKPRCILFIHIYTYTYTSISFNLFYVHAYIFPFSIFCVSHIFLHFLIFL